ncbi:hypothetical protein Taro_039393 [Colocasia esculenta]|uniref:Uncharacterized protein n=1 Tax=Colocasia esculenta TaxID=4460 RepID=A0A843WIR6_COLES|nr:hypothetical protein [Colocasia esculenta]
MEGPRPSCDKERLLGCYVRPVGDTRVPITVGHCYPKSGQNARG